MNILCEDMNDDFASVCDELTMVNETVYNNLTSDNFEIISVGIIDDCMEIKIGASGCDGSSWEVALVDSGAVAKSLPEQRYLKFQLKNEELCLAYFERIISFDLQELQISGSNEINLNLDGWETSINYKY